MCDVSWLPASERDHRGLRMSDSRQKELSTIPNKNYSRFFIGIYRQSRDINWVDLYRPSSEWLLSRIKLRTWAVDRLNFLHLQLA
jgi:hypothetical protein